MTIRNDQDWNTLIEKVSERVMQSGRDFVVKAEWAEFWREKDDFLASEESCMPYQKIGQKQQEGEWLEEGSGGASGCGLGSSVQPPPLQPSPQPKPWQSEVLLSLLLA